MNYVLTVLISGGRHEHRMLYAQREAAERFCAVLKHHGFTAWVARA